MEVVDCWERCTVQGCASSHVQPVHCEHTAITINPLGLGFPFLRLCLSTSPSYSGRVVLICFSTAAVSFGICR
jgi:hypothetical protein